MKTHKFARIGALAMAGLTLVSLVSLAASRPAAADPLSGIFTRPGGRFTDLVKIVVAPDITGKQFGLWMGRPYENPYGQPDGLLTVDKIDVHTGDFEGKMYKIPGTSVTPVTGKVVKDGNAHKMTFKAAFFGETYDVTAKLYQNQWQTWLLDGSYTYSYRTLRGGIFQAFVWKTVGPFMLQGGPWTPLR
jgi:hypothetical protein